MKYKIGIPEKIVSLIKALYEDSNCYVLYKEETSEAISVKTALNSKISTMQIIYIYALTP